MSAMPIHAGPLRAAAAGVLLLASLAASPAAAQQSAVSRVFRTLVTQLGLAVADDAPARERAAPRFEPCGTLYGPSALRIARGPEYARSHAEWIVTSYAIIRRSGLPLPVCFEFRQPMLTTNQGKYLLEANNQFIDSTAALGPAVAGTWAGFVLIGHTDPAEDDTALARLRAEWIQSQSPDPTCRYTVRRGSGPTVVASYRRVTYSPQPAGRGCPRPPG